MRAIDVLQFMKNDKEPRRKHQMNPTDVPVMYLHEYDRVFWRWLARGAPKDAAVMSQIHWCSRQTGEAVRLNIALADALRERAPNIPLAVLNVPYEFPQENETETYVPAENSSPDTDFKTIQIRL